MADEGDGRSGGDVQLDAVEHLGPLPVAEADRVEMDTPADPVELAGVGSVDHVRLLVEEVDNPVERSDRGQERL